MFYAILQDGGVDDHKTIYSNDKDFDENFPILCRLATTEMYNFYVKLGKGTKNYNEE